MGWALAYGLLKGAGMSGLTTHASARLFYPRNGVLTPASGNPSNDARKGALVENVSREIHSLIREKNYPCVAALQSLLREDYAVGIYKTLGTGACWKELRADLLTFVDEQKASGSVYRTMWAVFPEAPAMSEECFEQAMWKELSFLTSVERKSEDWGDDASSDPNDPTFTFSLRGTPFFVVGLHPTSSRLARRFRFSALVFNVSEQFEQLERAGKYAKMVDVNRKRDQQFQGSANPMCVLHGESAEAIQFSGKNNPAEWRCPFRFMREDEKESA